MRRERRIEINERGRLDVTHRPSAKAEGVRASLARRRQADAKNGREGRLFSTNKHGNLDERVAQA